MEKLKTLAHFIVLASYSSHVVQGGEEIFMPCKFTIWLINT